MGIIKALGVFLITSVILGSIGLFLPQYHPVERTQLESILKAVDYKEDITDLKDINNILDSIPVKVALLNKDKIVSSNNDKTSQEKRISEAEKNLPNLSKNVQAGDLTLNYSEDSETYKYLPFLIPLIGGLFTGLVFFILNKLSTNDTEMRDYLKGEVQRLEMSVQTYQAKEVEFSKKIEKSIPENLDEAQKLLKNLLKEKEVMLTTIDSVKASEVSLNKEIEKNKELIKETENKNKDLKTQLAKVTRQDKLVEELKAKNEKYNNDLKEAKATIKEFEANSTEVLQKEIDQLKTKLADTDSKYKTTKEELKNLSKFDVEKLSADNEEMKDKIQSLKQKVSDYEAQLKEGTVAELVKEKQEKEELKKQLKDVQHQLQESMSNLQETDAGKLKKDNIILAKRINEIKQELKDAQAEIQKITHSDAMKMDLIREQLKDRQKEVEEVRQELKEAQDKYFKLKESSNNPESANNLQQNELIDELNRRIKNLEEAHNQEKNNLSEKIATLQQIIAQSQSSNNEDIDSRLIQLEDELAKSKNLASKYQKERDEKFISFNELNSAFEATNHLLQRREQEILELQNKIKDTITS